jgi:nucleotide-binding universal stress UspA family protein
VILALITNSCDERLLLPHVIWQARQSRAKIVLAHLAKTHQMSLGARESLRCGPTPEDDVARAILERIARQLQWLGIASDPVVLAGDPEFQISSIARSCSADRVIVGFGAGLDLPKERTGTIVEQLLTNIEVPTCVIGPTVGSQSIRPTRNVTLAVSLDSDCDIPLSFAARFAQEQRAKLTILHVIDRKASGLGKSAGTPLAVASRLPVPTWREAELLCPTAIEIRKGDVAEAILRHAVSTDQDLILLCSPGVFPGEKSWAASVSYRVLAGAECPVFVLQRKLRVESLTTDRSLKSEKVPAYGETMIAQFQRRSRNCCQRPGTLTDE